VARIEMRAFALDLMRLGPALTPGIPARIRPATVEDLLRHDEADAPIRPLVNGLTSEGDRREALTRLLATGHVCFLAEHNGTILHYRWARRSDASISRMGIWATLRSGEACGFGSYTAPPARGHRLHPAVLTAMGMYLREAGMRTMYMWVMSGNTASLRTMTRVGAREIGRVVQWVWRLGREVLLYADVRAAAGLPADHLLSPSRLVLRRPLITVRWREAPSYRPSARVTGRLSERM
jgi:RimJ/RimL family protein N-acetyltransferase